MENAVFCRVLDVQEGVSLVLAGLVYLDIVENIASMEKR